MVCDGRMCSATSKASGNGLDHFSFGFSTLLAYVCKILDYDILRPP